MADTSEQTTNATGGTSSTAAAAGAGLGGKDVGATVSGPEGAKTNLTSEGVSTTSATRMVVVPGTGPGDENVGTIGVVGLGLYLIAAILLCFYGLIVLWPGPSPSQVPPGRAAAKETPTPSAAPSSDRTTQSSLAASASVGIPTPAASAPLSSDGATQTSSAASPPVSPTPSRIGIFGRQFEIWDEVRLLLIVVLAGALGSLVHEARSLFWYVGNRWLKWSWVPKYFLQPFAGSSLALIFYVVVRGGFFSPQTTFANTSPFGFAALAALVGLFSEQAVLKLKEVSEMVLAKPPPGADSVKLTSEEKLRQIKAQKIGKAINDATPLRLKESDKMDTITLDKLEEKMTGQDPPFERLPILSATGAPLMVVHRSVLNDFLLKKKATERDKDAKDYKLPDLIDAYQWLKDDSFATIPPTASAAEAKVAMARLKRGTDVFVTLDGTSSSTATGWITNVDLLQAAQV